MSKLKVKRDSLPPLQKLIVLYLAKSNPLTINETAKKIEKSYKPTHTAFRSLEKKKLIWKAGGKLYRNVEYPVYWLTGEGIITAIFEGADKALLFEESKKIFPNEELLCFLDIIQHVNPKVIELAYNVVKNKGTIDFVDVMTILVSITRFEDVDTMTKIFAVLKKYPEMYEQAKKPIRQMIEQLSQLISD